VENERIIFPPRSMQTENNKRQRERDENKKGKSIRSAEIGSPEIK